MKKVSLSLITLFSFCFVFAQEDDVLLVKEIKQSTIVTEPATLKKGFIKLGNSYAYSVVDKIFTDEGERQFITDNGWAKTSSYSIFVDYGLTNRIELSLNVPFERTSMYYSSIIETPLFQTTTPSDFKLKGKGLGDIQLGIHYQIIEGSKIKPSLTSKLLITLPTGEKDPTNISDTWEYDLPTGYGVTSFSLDLAWRKITYPYSYSFYGTYKFSLKGEKKVRVYEDPVEFKPGSFLQLGARFDFLLNDWIAIANDLFFVRTGEDKYYDPTDAFGTKTRGFSYMPNLHFQFKKFRFAQGVIIPLSGKSTGADPTFILIGHYIF